MQTQILTYLFIALMTVGCSPNKSGKTNGNVDNESMDGVSIIGTTWKLTMLEGTEVNRASSQREDIHFVLDQDGKVAGFSGCNRFNGTYTIEAGNRIRFSKMASTRMACPDLEFNEFDFLQIFELADNYTTNGNNLMLNVGKRAPLATFAKKVDFADEITEKYWKLVTLNGQAVEMSENQEREVYFMLKTDENKVKGFAGCNALNGTYSLEEGNRIRFSQMTTTLKACPDVDFNEGDFLKVFSLVDNYSLNGDRLTLNVGKRAPLAVFEAVYF